MEIETVIPFPSLFNNSVILTKLILVKLAKGKAGKWIRVINVVFSWAHRQEVYNTGL